MKKLSASLAALLLAAACLSGCGDGHREDTVLSPLPTAMPSASPYLSPDVDDGRVEDKDGFIDDDAVGKTSPSPSATVKPSSSPKS